MDKFKTITEKVKNYLNSKQNQKPLFFLCIGIIGIILILIPEIFPENEKISSESISSEITAFSEQENYIETRLESSISKIKGAGKTDITVTFESSEEFCFAKNSSENTEKDENSKENEFVIIDGEKGEKAILIKTFEAKIRGVLVVCEGGNDPLLREKIIKSVCALLDIPSNKVNVAEMA